MTTLRKSLRTVALVAAGVLVGSAPSWIFAAVPHTFANGTVADANEVNANFANHEARLAALEATPPAFLVYNNNCTGGQNGDVVWQLVALNNGNHYNVTTGKFTAPTAGVYSFSTNAQLYGLNGAGAVVFERNDVATGPTSYDDTTSAVHENVPLAATMLLNAGDTVNVNVGYTRNCQSWFTGHRVR